MKDLLLTHWLNIFEKPKKILDHKSLFEEYEWTSKEMEEKTISSSPNDLTEKRPEL